MKLFAVTCLYDNPTQIVESFCPRIFKTKEQAQAYLKEQYEKEVGDETDIERAENYGERAEVLNSSYEYHQWEIFEVEIEGQSLFFLSKHFRIVQAVQNDDAASGVASSDSS